LTSCLTGLESAVIQLAIFVFIFKTDKSKPVKQEVKWYNDTSPFSIPWTNTLAYFAAASMKAWQDFHPAVKTRRSTPSFPMASWRPKEAAMTPMLPTTELPDEKIKLAYLIPANLSLTITLCVVFLIASFLA
jgi:hypothetical protein